MRKSAILVGAILLHVSVGHAQLQGFGFKSGLSLANQDFTFASDVDFNSSARFGFDFGVFVEWFEHESVSLLTEAHFVQKGMVEEQPVTGPADPEPIGTLRQSNRVDYLSFPILLKLSKKANGFSPYAVAGPRLDILLGTDSAFLDEVYSQFETFNVGADVGIGAEIKLSRKLDALLEVRHGWDLMHSFENDFIGVKNRSLELLVGLRL